MNLKRRMTCPIIHSNSLPLCSTEGKKKPHTMKCLLFFFVILAALHDNSYHLTSWHCPVVSIPICSFCIVSLHMLIGCYAWKCQHKAISWPRCMQSNTPPPSFSLICSHLRQEASSHLVSTCRLKEYNNKTGYLPSSLQIFASRSSS